MSSGKIFHSHHHHTIIQPGYHLTSKYDLPGFRQHVQGEGKKSVGFDLPLTSMIDMFTILVIFLLMNFSATGEIFFIQKNLVLPEAKFAKPIESAPLISIVGSTVVLEAQQVGENPVKIEESDQNLPKLSAELRRLKILEEATRVGQPFKGQINIQADEKTPLIYIKRVMQTCILEGWTGINFAVRGEDGSSKNSGKE